jgi:hypothetical protein
MNNSRGSDAAVYISMVAYAIMRKVHGSHADAAAAATAATAFYGTNVYHRCMDN